MNADESPLTDEMEAFDIMDLASFLEWVYRCFEARLSLTGCRFAIQATHCLEALHK